MSPPHPQLGSKALVFSLEGGGWGATRALTLRGKHQHPHSEGLLRLFYVNVQRLPGGGGGYPCPHTEGGLQGCDERRLSLLELFSIFLLEFRAVQISCIPLKA